MLGASVYGQNEALEGYWRLILAAQIVNGADSIPNHADDACLLCASGAYTPGCMRCEHCCWLCLKGSSRCVLFGSSSACTTGMGTDGRAPSDSKAGELVFAALLAFLPRVHSHWRPFTGTLHRLLHVLRYRLGGACPGRGLNLKAAGSPRAAMPYHAVQFETWKRLKILCASTAAEDFNKVLTHHLEDRILA